MAFTPTAKQDEATALIGSAARHILLEGGGRSSKTFEFCWAIATRMIIADGSRHAILRFCFNHVITSIWYDTWPKMMRICYPDIKCEENKSAFFMRIKDSEVWFGGLDDKDRTDKILGNEYSTMFFNECSQMGFAAIETGLTRLAQKVEYKDPVTRELKILRLKAFYDQNPTSKSHFTYKIWHKRQTPDGKALPMPQNYAKLLMNPIDNKDNIAPEYIEELENSSERKKRRFLRGEYADETPGALFAEEVIDRNRVTDQAQVPEFVRIVVACDPSGSGDKDNADNDAIGIGAVGLGTDGKAYVLEDNTVKAGPATWGRVVVTTFDRLQANVVVGEKNFGGAMVEFTIQTAAKANDMRPVPFKYTVSSRGKHLRAEPVSALYEQNKVCHVGYFPELEEELAGFNQAGYIGAGSPNRADWLVFAITELFPGIVKEQKTEDPEKIVQQFRKAQGRGFWNKK